MRSAIAGAIALIAAAAVAPLPGCARRADPPPIASDAACARCGMGVGNPRFACERKAGGKWRAYDSIECLVRDAPGAGGTTVWLPDYDQRALHRADSLWIVRGDLATPMGGGLVAFVGRGPADEVAESCHGHLMRWADLAAPGEPAP